MYFYRKSINQNTNQVFSIISFHFSSASIYMMFVGLYLETFKDHLCEIDKDDKYLKFSDSAPGSF